MTTGWLEKVAARAKVSVSEAEQMLHGRQISPDRAMRPARQLSLTEIAFKGEKKGVTTGRIDFKWGNLTPGVWAVTSYDNLVGKSSVLEIVLWCLRGERKGLQDDVRSWLESVSLGFDVDGQSHCLEVELVRGAPSGVLTRKRPDGKVEVIDQFASEEGFAAVMSLFMMSTLDLEPVPARQKDDDGGRSVAHGWAALSGALYFGGDHKLLLGDVLWGGLPARMLQMYLGLPWARTVMQTSTAKKEVEQEIARVTRAKSDAAGRILEARKRLEGDLETARKMLDATSSEQVTAEQLEILVSELARLTRVVFELERRLATTLDESIVLTRMADEDERALRDRRENIVATAFFNGLQPTCCPRCEARVTKERVRQESTDLSCSVCLEPISPEVLDGESDSLQLAQDRLAASKTAVERSKVDVSELQAQVRKVRNDLRKAQDALANAAGSNSFLKRRDAELEVAKLEGALIERQSEPVVGDVPTDAAIVDAAFEEAKFAFEDQRGDLLSGLNEEILRLGISFGVLGLEEVVLNSNAQMKIVKGGEPAYFSKLTPGERLRLRIATAIALLRVGRERGVGRHPGLLIIDSPGAEETAENNLATLLKELRSIAEETPGLQILIASANADAVVDSLGKEHCRVAVLGKYLW